MPGFLLALLAAGLASIGGRDQVIVAQLSASFRKPAPLLVAAWIAAALSGAVAAAAGAWLAPMMPPGGKAILVALALGFAALELAWRSLRAPAPQEPTRSLAAILIVLVANQIGDAARFVIFALAVWNASPVLVAVGGTLGAGAALTAGWLCEASLASSATLNIVRGMIAAMLALAAIAIVLVTLELL